MARNTIYPPILEGILPAFTKDEEGKGQIVVPFTFNSAVTQADFNGAVMKLKTIQEDVVIAQATATRVDISQNVAIFDLQSSISDTKVLADEVEVGSHYKLQLALSHNQTGRIGWFSSVGVIKCTSPPKVFISGGGGTSLTPLDEKAISPTYPYFVGIYRQKSDNEEESTSYQYDTNERIYSSYFEIYTKDDDNNKITVEKSEEKIHSAILDEDIFESKEEWWPTVDLSSGINYYLKFYVTTINNLQWESPEYSIVTIKAAPLDIPADLIMDYDEENGVAELYFKAHSLSARATGKFVITRKNLNLEDHWRVVYKFALATEYPDGLIWRDFTVEQGSTYAYAIQQFNENNMFTERKLFTYNGEEEMTVTFDHMYLFDGKKQLKISFNPKVSTFQHFVSEQKVDTIGSKYPFFFRNGTVGYKTFPISGLVSMLTDNDELFTSHESIERPSRKQYRDKTRGTKYKVSHYFETDLNWKNVESERLFKLKVLDWLNDGELKLFRSPQEGNYLVRLMNNSLTPVEQLGRMLHTFQSTAYEADDISYDTLVKYGIIQIPTELSTVSQKINSIEMQNYVDDSGKPVDILREEIIDEDGNSGWSARYLGFVNRIDFRDLLPGTQIKLTFSDGTEKVITIGKTGAYKVTDLTVSLEGAKIISPSEMIEGGTFSILDNVVENSSKTKTVFSNIYGRKIRGSALVYYNAATVTGFDAIWDQKITPFTPIQITDGEIFPDDFSNILERPSKIDLLDVYKKDIVNLYVQFDQEKDEDGNVLSYKIPDDFKILEDGTLLQGHDLLYFDRDCSFQVMSGNHSEDNLVPNALYNIRFVRKQDLPLKYGASRIASEDWSRDWIPELEGDYSFATKINFVDRRSGDLFWVNDLYYQEHQDEEIYYVSNPFLFYDAKNNKVIRHEDWEPYFIITNLDGTETKIDLRETRRYKMTELVPDEDFVSIRFGNGVYANCYYQNLSLKYVFENPDSRYYNVAIKDLLNEYEDLLNKYENDVLKENGESVTVEDINNKKQELINALQTRYDEWVSLKEDE